MRRNSLMLLVGGIAAALVGPAAVRAANCALRNPDRQIYEFFPDATSYRSIVAEVDRGLKSDIESRLGSQLALSDLGKHTVYIVLKDKVPVGFVHARSEIGKSGSVELVWALTLDLAIKDFRVQRSREKHTKVIRSSGFRDRLAGRNLRELFEVLTDGNTGVDEAALQIPPEASTIAHTAVLCGAKCRLITEIAFRDAVHDARLLGNVYRFFPGTAKVTKIAAPFSDEAVATVKRLTGSPVGQIDPESCTVLRALDHDGETIGVCVASTWSAHSAQPEIWWAVAADGVIREVIALGDLDDQAARAFSELSGKGLADLESGKTNSAPSAVKCASELLALLTAHKIGS